MKKGLAGIAGMLVLIASFTLIGCSKKAPSAERSAGISKEKSSEAPAGGEGQTPLQEENVPSIKEEPSGFSGGGEETSRSAALENQEETPASLEDVFFDFDQWVVRSDAKRILEQDAKWLAAHPGKIQIEGHGDERGTNEYNLVLGEKRAKSTMNFLVNLGVNASRISVISYGEEKPFCAEKEESCYQKNRRTHFVVK